MMGARAVLRRLALGLLLGLPAFAFAAATVTDDRGRTVTLARPPMRVIALLPSLSETVCALGACERLVGVDNYSNWPAPVAALPKLGGVDDASVERIVALQPDLVLMGASGRVAARLESLGIPVVGLDLKTLPDVHRVLATVSRALQAGNADAVSRDIEAGITAAAAAVPASARGVRVYLEISGGGYAASESSHVGAILRRLGAANVVPGHLGTVPRLNPEFVVRADPGLIIVAQGDAAEVLARPGWSRIQAVRERRVCALTPAEGDVVARPGPRLGEAAQVLLRCLGLAAKAAR